MSEANEFIGVALAMLAIVFVLLMALGHPVPVSVLASYLPR